MSEPGPTPTPRINECDSCEEPANKRCAGCSKVWYCSSECQRSSWYRRVFDCNPRKPINTAYYLCRAAFEDRFPDDPQTQDDYGFNKAFTTANQSKLLGLYRGLLVYKELDPRTLHRWRVQGVLVQGIKSKFEADPPANRGDYYPWFLQNQWVLDGTDPPLSEEEQAAIMVRTAWQFIGGSPADSTSGIKRIVVGWPKDRQQCFRFYTCLLSHSHPSPDLLDFSWVTFGFCVCDWYFEMQLARLYQCLIHQCAFEEFVAAYTSSSLISLFDRKGFREGRSEHRDLEHVLSGSPKFFESVWSLKRFVMMTEEASKVSYEPAITVDYGFSNCKGVEEWTKLKRVYKKVFEDDDARPLELHRAALDGKILEYVSSKVEIGKADRKLFRRLMKNVYPLPDL